MILKRFYKVAGHVFGISGEAEVFKLMTNYEPFAEEDYQNTPSNLNNPSNPIFLAIADGKGPVFNEEIRQEEEGQTIICGKTAEGEYVFEFRWWEKTAGWLVCSADYSKGRLITTGKHMKMAIDNALMVLFALATADRQTVLFHAAVVSYEGKGYMFLGPSGTGKSTHARLWLQHIEGTALVNDDNPVVRIDNQGTVVVYGSPWSGKTPCYRNVSYPLGGIAVLSQAPYNKMSRLDGLLAYAALMSSISGKRWDSRIANGLHQTENMLAKTVPVWHLDCLPDEAAAKMCWAKVKS